MKVKLTMVFALAALGVILAFTMTPAARYATASASPAASAQPLPATASPVEPHPRIRAALLDLRGAKAELQKAAHDFGGHRDEALEAVDKTIQQLEVCLKYDKE